jgi:hypothetical protein
MVFLAVHGGKALGDASSKLMEGYGLAGIMLVVFIIFILGLVFFVRWLLMNQLD